MRPNTLLQFLAALLILPCATALAASDRHGIAEDDTTVENTAAELTDKLAGTMAEINAQYRLLLQRMQEIESERRELELMMHKVADLSEERGGTDTSGSSPAGTGWRRATS